MLEPHGQVFDNRLMIKAAPVRSKCVAASPEARYFRSVAVMTHIGRAVTSTVGRQQMAGHAAVMVHYFSISAQLRGTFTVTGRWG